MAPIQSWTEEQDLEIFRKLVSTTLATRSQYYASPELAPWAGNGGDKINKKIQQMLKKFASQVPGGGQAMDEELANISKGKKIKGAGEPKSNESTPKKRKLGPAVRLRWKMRRIFE